MLALSIRQPWAWLILHGGPDGIKDIENRTWATRARGVILVHTGLQPGLPRREWMDWGVPTDAPMGGIVGQAVLVDCVTESDSDWFEGPYGFVLRNPKPLPFRPYPGRLGFFQVPDPRIRDRDGGSD